MVAAAGKLSINGLLHKMKQLGCLCVYLTVIIVGIILYSRKYWRELNLAVEPKIAIARILADLNLAVRYGIAIRIHASRKFDGF